MRINRAAAFWIGVAGVGVFLVLRVPKEDVLNDNCEPRSLLNRARANIDGGRFWRAQLTAVDNSIEMPTRIRMLTAQGDAIAKTLSAQGSARLDSLYAANPRLPRVSTSQSDVLRQQADSIDWSQTQDRVNEVLLARALKLLQCRPEVQRKAQQT